MIRSTVNAVVSRCAAAVTRQSAVQQRLPARRTAILQGVFASACATALGVGTASGQSQLIELSGASLTSYKYTSASGGQDLRPRFDQRGVGLDGSPRADSAFGWAMAANPFSTGTIPDARLGDVRIGTGNYDPHTPDLVLEGAGFNVEFRRSYNLLQEASNGSHRDSINSTQGINWMNELQPEIVQYVDGSNAANNRIYLLNQAGAYHEFLRTGSSSNEYVGVNGTAGVIQYAAGSPDIFTYTDQKGTEVKFFGFNTSGGNADGQLWKITDAAGNIAYVGNSSSNAASAASSGYSSKRLARLQDTVDRQLTFLYTVVDTVPRLEQIQVKTKTGGTWDSSPTGVVEVARILYEYYSSTDNTNGPSGNLKTVTVRTSLPATNTTLPLEPPTPPATQTYAESSTIYHYYSGSFDAESNPGNEHAIKLVVQAEGVRRYNQAQNPVELNAFKSASTANLKPYASAYFEYTADGDYRIAKTWSDGQCGCGGGSGAGDHLFTYTQHGSYSTYIGNSTYDNGWATRVVVEAPAPASAHRFDTYYFDEHLGRLSTVVTAGDPAASPASTWATHVTRTAWNGTNKTGGTVDKIYSPENIGSSGYTHSGGSFSTSSSTGLVTIFTRQSTGLVAGFPTEVRWQTGTSGTQYLIEAPEYETSSPPSKTIGTVTLKRPVITAREAYKDTTITKGDSGKFDAQSFATTAVSGSTAVQQATQTHPTVATLKNGSGSPTSRKQYFRADGTPSLSLAEDGVVTYRKYTGGLLTMLIEDADTGQNGGGQDLSEYSGGIPSGFASSGTELHLKTTYTYDSMGRLVDTVLPSGRMMSNSYTQLSDGRQVTLSIPRVTTGGTTTYYGPVNYTVTNLAGNVEFQGVIAFSGGSTTTAPSGWISTATDDPIAAVLTGSLSKMTVSHYNASGTRRTETRTYYGPSSYDVTLYGYDAQGQLDRTKLPDGTIHRTVRNARGLVTDNWVGTNDRNFSGGETTGTDNMTQTDALEYSLNGHLTKRTTDPDGKWTNDNTPTNPDDRRITEFAYDTRGFRIQVKNPEAPHLQYKVNNKGQVIAVGRYSTAPSATADPTSTATGRLDLSETLYNEKDQVWKVVRHKVLAADGSFNSADDIERLTWHDSVGRVIKVDGEQLTKSIYNRIGMPTNEFVLSSVSDSIYTDAHDVANDVVLQEEQTYYSDSRRLPLMRVRIDRYHNDFVSGSKTLGPLDTDTDLSLVDYSGSKVKGLAYITTYSYTDLDQLKAQTVRGTNGGTNYDRDGEAVDAVPTRSDTVLVTSYTYNDDGTVKDVTDPKGLVTRTEYDTMGRATATIQNYTGGSTASSTRDNDIFTRRTYASGHLTEEWSDTNGNGNVDSGEYIVRHTHGVTKGTGTGDSRLASNSLLYKTVYPEQTASQAEADRRTLHAYNAQGQLIWMQNAAGNVHEYDYDNSGRRTQDRLTTVGSGIDGAVRRIQTDYDDSGRVATISSYDDEDVGQGTLLNQTKRTYDGWGMLTTYEQDHDSAVGTGDAYTVAYTYEKATGGPNLVRCTGQDLKHGSTTVQSLTFEYLSTSGGVSLDDDNASRVTTIKIGGSVRAEYRYLGVDTLVETKLPEASTYSRLHDGASTPTYPGLDFARRFVQTRWTKDLATDQDFVSLDTSYDRNGNVTRIVDNVHKMTAAGNHLFDAVYSYDNLNRLTGAREGHWDGSAITTGNRNREELWTLSVIGNQTLNRLDLNGDGDYADTVNGLPEFDDTRTYSDANELKTRDTNSSSPAEYTLSYDKTGNCTNDGERQYVWDGWNRLVEVKNAAGTVTLATNGYNGEHHKIKERRDNSQSGGGGPDGVLDANDLDNWFAHDEHWRAVGVYRDTDTYPKLTYVHNRAGRAGMGDGGYPDLVHWQDKDTANAWDEAAGSSRTRHYTLQNHRGDMLAILKANGSQVLEWVKYYANGNPQNVPFSRMDGDDDVDPSDASTYVNAWSTGTYFVRIDTNLDGSITSADLTAFNTDLNTWPNAGTGELSRNDSTFNVANRIGYAGGQWDPVAKLYHYRNRWMNPRIGRFLSRDPQGHVDGLNTYRYVKNNPLKYTDPWGLAASKEPPSPPADSWIDCIGNARSYSECMSCCKGSGSILCTEYCSWRFGSDPPPDDDLPPFDPFPTTDPVSPDPGSICPIGDINCLEQFICPKPPEGWFEWGFGYYEICTPDGRCERFYGLGCEIRF